MDDIVRQALAKWPNVPHCHGWLALDARGNWRMRDERTQALGLPGDRITNPGLVAFINRNYLHDDQGGWYFQNGPQRVYVDLQATPYIARTDPRHGFMLHTGEALGAVDAAWLTDGGQFVLRGSGRPAQLDDRDVGHFLGLLRLDGKPAGDEQLLAWLEQPDGGQLAMLLNGTVLPVRHLRQQDMPAYFGYVAQPRPAA